MNEKKKNLYLPIEIKSRELNSKILLGIEAVKAGYRVFIGDKSGIELAIKSQGHGGIYFYKSMSPRQIPRIKNDVDHIVVLDEELGFALKDRDFFFKKRASNNKDISQYYVINEQYKSEIENIHKELAGKIFSTGWPRAEIWSKKHHHIYTDEIKKIKEIYGRYILFSSDFGFLNQDRIRCEISKYKKINAQDYINFFKKKSDKTIREFDNFKKLLIQIDKDKDLPTLIIRPHPAEDHSVWSQIAKEFKKNKVIFEGEITPWLLASECLIHRGCTTSYQAHLSGIKSIFVDLVNGYDSSIPSHEVSHLVVNFDDMKKEIIELENNNVKVEKADYKYDSCLNIISCLDMLEVNESFFKKPKKTNLLFRGVATFIKDAISTLPFENDTFAHYKMIKSNKIPGGIKKSDIQNLTNKFEFKDFRLYKYCKNVMVLD